MGMESHAFNALRYLASKRDLGSVLTIGRQSLDVPPTLLSVLDTDDIAESSYCEPVLLALGAVSVESIDFSDYEKATYCADLNTPYRHHQAYDGVFDFGSSEHIFDIANVFRNIIGLAAVGGSIVHVLPVNNLSGHGFYQFCSDLMFDLYCDKNGFGETEVFYASSLDADYWYRAPPSRPGMRVRIVAVEPIVLVCITRKLRVVEQLDVQQSFYSQTWQSTSTHPELPAGGNTEAGLRSRIRKLTRGLPGYTALRNVALVLGLAFGSSAYSLRGRQFVKCRVADLTGSTVGR